MHPVKVGSDIECFVVNKENQVVSAIGLLGGTKEAPRTTTHGWVQEDNVLAEFNINPATSSKEFANNISNVVGDLINILPDGWSVRFDPSNEMTIEQLSHPLAMIAGCEPDYDAYEVTWDSKRQHWVSKSNPAPDIETTPLRTAGGHIHISWDIKLIQEQFAMIRAMDMYVGLPSLLLDNDTERRKLYGKAGAYRLKRYGDVYGVEWRTASNFWAATPELSEWAFNNTIEAFNNKDAFLHPNNKVKEIINNGDKGAATALIAARGITMP